MGRHFSKVRGPGPLKQVRGPAPPLLLPVPTPMVAVIDSDVTRNFTFGGLKRMASAEREAITGVWG